MIADDERPDRSPASWAATAPRRIATTREHLRRGRVLVARGDRRAVRAATTSRPMPAIASSAASTRRRRSQHIERITRLILEICGGEPGPWTTRRASCRSASRSRCAWRARAKVHRHAVADAARCAGDLHAPGPGGYTVGAGPMRRSSSRRRRGASTIAIEEDLIEEVVRVLGYERIPASRRVRRRTCARAPEGRRSLHALRAPLAACDYQEVINFSFVEERWERDLAGNANPIRLLNPIAEPDRRDALDAAGQPGRERCATTSTARSRACGCSSSAACSCAIRRAADGASTSAGMRQPMRVGGLAFGPALRRAVGRRRSAAVDFFDVKGDVEACCAAAGALRAATASGAASGTVRARIELDGAARRLDRASCTRAGSRSTSCRGRRCCSSSTCDPLHGVPLPAVQRGVEVPASACATWRWSSTEAVPAAGHAGRRCEAASPASCRSVWTVRPLPRRRTVGTGGKSLAFR